jgi:hypothetical protein
MRVPSIAQSNKYLRSLAARLPVLLGSRLNPQRVWLKAAAVSNIKLKLSVICNDHWRDTILVQLNGREESFRKDQSSRAKKRNKCGPADS